MKPKNINSLMKYMRDVKGIKIEGSTQKRKLRNMGYFHGYKGYRYCHSPNSLFKYTEFDQLQSVYNFDMKLKSLFYPQIMFLETTIKNYSLEIILDKSKSSHFTYIYTNLMTDYKTYTLGSDKYKKAFNKKLAVRNKIYSVISRDYGKSNIVNHYYDRDKPIPIWGIFEIISLGEFGNFLSCLSPVIRKDISSSVGIKSSFDPNGKMLEMIVYTLKDLRNAVAHNNTIFDTRFKTSSVNSSISKYISAETEIKNIDFNTIADYIILISFVMKLFKCNKKDIVSFISKFEEACDNLRLKVPSNIFSKIVYTDTRRKLSLLKNYL